MTYKVTLDPVGMEMEVEEGETILNAAFRQGVALMHGCKEGQCSTCKSILVDGDVEMERYSTFALPDHEKEEGYILLCKTLCYSDVQVELLQYDEEALKVSIPIKTYQTTIESIESVTHDIRKLTLKLVEPKKISFHAGQFVDIYAPGQTYYRSYSMGNTPKESGKLEFMMKIFKGGKFSTLLDEVFEVGDELEVKGPYGNCIRREDSQSDIVLIGGGSGMAPLWSILNDMDEKNVKRNVTFFYGARTKQDLFYLDKFAELEKRLDGFRFIPALSEPLPEDKWDGETGFITEVIERYLKLPSTPTNDLEAFLCGPAPMIDAAITLLRGNGVTTDRISFDKFVAAATT
ncbi:NADH:ubiquinone reductase (Na(+)-transporting) subunit F [Paenisporosarcina antarctica]|uniref:2Fe-2S iron-sulfur cluster binding domain-containing protein n=1 Tax=Paenisporosarcina antarctica TaxID=417367 RepID=A0A4P6ZV80_9BACL|nr:2Fe-2S iron-sulfur cluster binding domain-containing protein [Paenisporosarcina antarctica]QBP39869.1 2Fe-2S iron-sulfur cluster binding domain-containing protein [Paenisporosarcina antarctica]